MNVTRGKPIIFDMELSPGDFVSLIYLLKEPRHEIDLKVREICPKLQNVAANNAVHFLLYTECLTNLTLLIIFRLF